MTKEQFVRTLAKEEGISIKQAREEVNRVFGHVMKTVPTLADGEKLDITGIVQFVVSDVPARTARNPKTGEEVAKEATRKVNIRAMASLKKQSRENNKSNKGKSLVSGLPLLLYRGQPMIDLSGMKPYVIDTNTLLDYPTIVNKYQVVVTSHVLREIEKIETKKVSV